MKIVEQLGRGLYENIYRPRPIRLNKVVPTQVGTKTVMKSGSSARVEIRLYNLALIRCFNGNKARVSNASLRRLPPVTYRL